MRRTIAIALSAVAVALAQPAAAAPLTMHADWSASTLTSNTNTGFGFGAGIGLPVLPHLDLGVEMTQQRHAHEAVTSIPENFYQGGGNDYVTSVLIAARASLPSPGGRRLFIEVGAGGARLYHSAEHWRTMNGPSRYFVVPAKATDMPATMVGFGYQTRPILGLTRVEAALRYQWMSAPAGGTVTQTGLSVGVAL